MTSSPTPTPSPDPTRAEGEPVSTHETYTDGEEYTYLRETEEVRYVAAYRHADQDEAANGSAPSEREPLYETTAFENRGETRCASVGAAAARNAVTERLDGDVGASVGVSARDDDLSIVVRCGVTRDRDGNVVDRTDATLAELVASGPRTVDASVSLAGRVYESSVPVFVEWRELRLE